MVGRVMGLMMLGCVLGSTGCRKAEAKRTPEMPSAVATRAESPAPVAAEKSAEPRPEAPAAKPEPRPAPEGIAFQESQSQTREAPAPRRQEGRPQLDAEDRIWLSESAEAARAGNANIAHDAATEEIAIASGTVDGRVKRVRARTIEVSDGEGNVYELRIDHRSRGLRQGRKVPLKHIAEGTPVRASFDLMGAGDTLARDIVLRR
jgi:hypothetical protein